MSYYLEDYEKDAKYIAIVELNEDLIYDDGYRCSMFKFITSDNLEALENCLNEDAYRFVRGYIWEGDVNETDPVYMLERECDEATNKWLDKLVLVPYSDVEHFEGHEWKDIEAFLEEAEDIRTHGAMETTALYYGEEEVEAVEE